MIAYLGLTLDVLYHCHWIWIGHSVGNYCRAKDFSQIGNIHFSVWALSHPKQKNIKLEDLLLHLNMDQNIQVLQENNSPP